MPRSLPARSATLPPRFAAAVLVLSVSGGWSGPAPAADPTDCFADLMAGTGAEIVCSFPVRPGPVEREELVKATRGYFLDASCLVEIRIQRALITAALETPDYVFEAPAQPVACDVTGILTEKRGAQVIPIAATFAPRVVIKGGEAIEATPGLGNVTGVTRVLSWPVEYWMNKGGTVRAGMLQVINAWLVHMRALKAGAK